MRVGRLLALGACVWLVAAAQPAAADAANVETLLLQQVNASRAAAGKPALARHAGLSTQARNHSSQMASDGDLHHIGFEARLDDATPDPSEANGAPDDGFDLDGACENVALRGVPGESDAQVAQGLNQQWLDSPPHRVCMLDESASHNAAGVGVFRDGSGTWWATLIAVTDGTLPSGGAGPPPPDPGAPAFGAGDPCGGSVAAPSIGAATTASFTATDPQGATVTLTASGLPAWASFSSVPSAPAAGVLASDPALLDWVFSLFLGAPQVTVSASDPGGATAACGFVLQPTLL